MTTIPHSDITFLRALILAVMLGFMSTHLAYAASTSLPQGYVLTFTRADLHDPAPPHEMAQKTKTVRAIVSAYTSSPDETDDTPTINASGGTPSRGSIACPTSLSFGTKVKINGHTYVCDDRMNDRYDDGKHFDLWMESKHDAFAFGRREVTVTVFE